MDRASHHTAPHHTTRTTFALRYMTTLHTRAGMFVPRALMQGGGSTPSDRASKASPGIAERQEAAGNKSMSQITYQHGNAKGRPCMTCKTIMPACDGCLMPDECRRRTWRSNRVLTRRLWPRHPARQKQRTPFHGDVRDGRYCGTSP